MARFEALDAWRGVCALLVVLFHFCFLFSSPFISARLISNAYLFVDFFFVLSGFVVCHAYRERLGDAASWMRFVVRRFGRLWPLHAVMLAAVGVFILAVNAVPHPERFAWSLGEGEFSLRNMVLHAALLNAVNLSGTAWNAPSWSIGAEFYTYLLFGAACGLALRRLTGLAALLALASLALLAVVSPTYMNSTADFGLLRCISGFFAGVVAYRLHERLSGRRAGLPVLVATAIEGAVVALVVLFVRLAGRGPDAVAALSLAAPAVFALAVMVFAREAGHLSRLLRTAPFAALGRWSYSLYMGHHLVLLGAVFGVWTLSRRSGLAVERTVIVEGHPKTIYDLGGTVPSLLLLAAVLALAVALAAFTHARVEEPARRAFNRLAQRMEAQADTAHERLSRGPPGRPTPSPRPRQAAASRASRAS